MANAPERARAVYVATVSNPKIAAPAAYRIQSRLFTPSNLLSAVTFHRTQATSSIVVVPVSAALLVRILNRLAAWQEILVRRQLRLLLLWLLNFLRGRILLLRARIFLCFRVLLGT